MDHLKSFPWSVDLERFYGICISNICAYIRDAYTLHAYVYICMHGIYVIVHTCVYIHIYIYIYICVHIDDFLWHISNVSYRTRISKDFLKGPVHQIYLYTTMSTYMYIYVYIHIYRHGIYTYICYLYIDVYIYMYRYICVYMHIIF